MKKLITLTLVTLIISSTKSGWEERFLWGTTVLHIFIAKWTTQGITNKTTRALAFIAIMSALIFSIGATEAATNSLIWEIEAFSFARFWEIFEKANEATIELLFRVYKNEWRKFNPSEVLRRTLFGTAILFGIITIAWETTKKIPSAIRNRKRNQE